MRDFSSGCVEVCICSTSRFSHTNVETLSFKQKTSRTSTTVHRRCESHFPVSVFLAQVLISISGPPLQGSCLNLHHGACRNSELDYSGERVEFAKACRRLRDSDASLIALRFVDRILDDHCSIGYHHHSLSYVLEEESIASEIKDAKAFVEGMRYNTHLQGLWYVRHICSPLLSLFHPIPLRTFSSMFKQPATPCLTLQLVLWHW